MSVVYRECQGVAVGGIDANRETLKAEMQSRGRSHLGMIALKVEVMAGI